MWQSGSSLVGIQTQSVANTQQGMSYTGSMQAPIPAVSYWLQYLLEMILCSSSFYL